MAAEYQNPYKHQVRRSKKWLIAAVVLAVVVLSGAVFFVQSKRSSGPIPKTTQKSVSFAIYYPDQNKLPNGYVFDKNSVNNLVKNGVAYTVTYGQSKKLVFSLQPKPSDNELESFRSSYIPLRTNYQTVIGQSEIGAYNNHGKVETLVSLPTNTSTWIIVTAPYDIDQNQLKQVLNSLKS